MKLKMFVSVYTCKLSDSTAIDVVLKSEMKVVYTCIIIVPTMHSNPII